MKATLNIDNMFHGLSYYKKADEIVEKCKIKIVTIEKKIEERKGRIKALRTEHSIDDGALIQLLNAARRAQANRLETQSFTYNPSNNKGSMGEEKSIAAGVVNNLLTEGDFVESEKAQVNDLELIVRNLKTIPRFASDGTQLPDGGFQLSTDTLEFLGF